jgi:plasmid stabilization system protein ParE
VARYLLTSEAEQDIDLIKTYLLEQGGSRLAQHVLSRVRRAMQFLGARPDAGHARRDSTSEPVKFWQVFSYLIIYDPAPRPVHILRVLHASRDIEAILR